MVCLFMNEYPSFPKEENQRKKNIALNLDIIISKRTISKLDKSAS